MSKTRIELINQILGIHPKVIIVDNDLRNEKGEYYHEGKYYTEEELRQKLGPGLKIINWIEE